MRALKPKTLLDAYDLAKLYEERHSHHRAVNFRPAISRPPLGSSSNFNSRMPTGNLSSDSTFHSKVPIGNMSSGKVPMKSTQMEGGQPWGGKRLSQAEYQEKRARNQCFLCDEPYKPGHNCRRAKALLIEGFNVAEVEEDTKVSQPLPSDKHDSMEEETVYNLDEPLIQLYVLAGEVTHDTMQLKGVLGSTNKQVHVLIDSGATHNFVHPSVIKYAEAWFGKGKSLQVMVASGTRLHTTGFIPSLEMCLQGYSFTSEFYVLPISGCEVILGAPWLRSLGDILWNFDALTMKFHKNGVSHVLQGLQAEESLMVSCRQMVKTLLKEKEAMIVQLQPAVGNCDVSGSPLELKELLEKYSELFSSMIY